MSAGIVFAQRGGYGGGAVRGTLPSSTAIGAGALTHGPSSTAASTSAAFASSRPYTGNHGGSYGGRYNNRGYNNYRNLPRSYVIAPFYYPSFDWSGGTDTSAAPSDEPGYGGYGPPGPDPATDALMQNQAALGQQVQRLTTQVNGMMYGQPGPDYPAASQQQAPPAPPITLVLHSGEQLQVQNYAVTNNMFWDFTQRGTRKIPVSSIDVAASAKATEAAGGDFPALSGATP
jgi:hypothetical protein